ncbi:MAG: hypothetical protein KBT04_03820, partial [Bacteroidales bacterium]|nr:hypothetical protein [Candidatus Colimorpha onthohippi]
MKKSVLLFLALMTFVPVLWAKLPDRLVFVGQGTNDSVKLSKIGNPKDIELFCIKNSGVPTPFVLDSSYGVGVNDTLTLLTHGKNRSFSKSTNDYYQFVITGKVAVSGSVMALVGIGGSIIPCDYCFYSLFRQCRGLTTLPKLPATRLKDHCYERMFEGCSSLVTEADTLPAMTLCRSCYQSMFENCTSLVKAPVLPASQLAPSCYNAMFRGCASLAQTQDTLPAVVVDTT